MITIMTAQTKTILHLDKYNRAIVIYNITIKVICNYGGISYGTSFSFVEII